MSVIYKYPVSPGETPQVVEMPASSEILSAINQDGAIFIYVLVHDPDRPPVKKEVLVVGTGWKLYKEKRFISTVQVGRFVWHVFEAYRRGEPRPV